MTNPTTLQEDLLLAGTSLSTLGWNVSTLNGQEAFPAKVGDNIIVPYRTGRLWKPKTYDQRVLTYSLWIQGKRIDGTIPTVDGITLQTVRQAMRAQFNTNLDVLKTLISRVDSQITMQKIRLYPTGPITFQATGEVASGTAAVGGGTSGQEFTLTPNTPWYGTLTLDIAMADPWWYALNPVTTTFSFPSSTVTNPGTATADGGPAYTLGPMTVTFTGPLTTPRLRNLSLSPVVSVQYDAAVASGEIITIDCNAMTCTSSVNGNVIGNLRHAGSLRWMFIVPGANSMQLDNGTTGTNPGSGTVNVFFYPPYA